MQGEQRSSFRPDIEGLRAVAILTVVLYHLNLAGISGGFIGVDVFFVISGFLITGQLVNNIGSAGGGALPAFWARRIKRLLPAASATLIATVIAWRICGLVTLPRTTAIDAIYATFYGLNYRLAHTGTQYFNPLSQPPPLQHFWSLGVEEQFYVVWPLLILAVFWHRARRQRRYLAVALTVIGAVSLVLSVHLSASTPTWSFYGLHTRAWELAAGGLIALGAHRAERLRPVIAVPLTWIGLVAIAVAAVHFTDKTTYPGSAAILPVAGAALVIAGGCSQPRLGAGLLLNLRPAQEVGRLSYSWYLWHFPIIIIVPVALGHGIGTGPRVVLGLLSLGVAALSYKIVEEPFRRQRWRPARWFALAGTSMALVAIISMLAIAFPRPAVGPGPSVAAPRLTGRLHQQQAEFADAVLASLAIKQVPHNLHPDLAHAFGDGPTIASDCFLGFSQETVGSCVYGDPHARRTVVMFGDSSVAQWLPAVEQVAIRNHWRVVMWGKASCTINHVTIPNVLTLQPYRSCLAWRDQTIQRIRALDPQVVITGEFLGYGPLQYSASQWTSFTVSTIKELSAPGRTIGYLMPDAMPYRDMPACLASHLKSVQGCTIPLVRAALPPARWASELATLPSTGVTMITPESLMCTSVGCPPIVGNVPVYRDKFHVTATYAKLLTPMFEPLLPPPANA